MKLTTKNIEVTLGLGLWLSLWWLAFYNIKVIEAMDVDPEFVGIALRILPFIAYLFIVVGYYLYHIQKNTKLSKEAKTLWSVAILFGNTVAIPIYWCIYAFSSSADAVNKSSQSGTH